MKRLVFLAFVLALGCNSQSALPPPAAPIGVTAAPGDRQVTPSWTASSGATSYNLYWSTSAAVSKSNGTKVAGATSGAVVTNLTNGTAYYFVVTAANAGGDSPESSPAASATPLPPPPSAPAGVTAAPGNGHATAAGSAASG